jgi:hypothetical protein
VAPAAWSYYGPAVLEEINSVGGEVRTIPGVAPPLIYLSRR